MIFKPSAWSRLIVPFTAVAVFGLVWAQDGPETVIRGTKQFRQRIVIAGLANPWEITWGPDGQLWVTERTGKRISRIDPNTGAQQVAAVIDEVMAPGGQDGLLGLALHPDLLQGKGNDYVYAVYTYTDPTKKPWAKVVDPKSPYRQLRAKVVRFTYDQASGKLGNRVDLLTGLPAGNDHEAGRIKVGPDKKLYITIGDQGHNQLGNFCSPIEAQRLPTKAEVEAQDYDAYVGKSLRLNPDGSIPKDNPKLAGVVSHVYTYGHRNTQGIDFGPDGTLYASEHGPKTDDEINILKKGANYGWPHVAGLPDNKAYEYARWADAKTPCSQLRFSDLQIHPSVPRAAETDFKTPFERPIATMFTVPTGFNFSDPICKGIDYICWPTVGPSSIEYYASKGKGIPGWDRVLFVTTMKRGSLYVAPLKANGREVAGPMHRYFQSEDRYRDSAVSPDGRTIFLSTDSSGLVEAAGGGATSKMAHPGAIMAFTYEGEGTGAAPAPVTVSEARRPAASEPAAMPNGAPAQYTAAQAAAGKTAYNGSCAVCHGSTLTNGTFGTPLGGEYFKNKWAGRSMRAFFEKSKTMPPAAPASLSDETYANIVAYVLELNGLKAGSAKLPSSAAGLDGMAIK